MANRKVIIVGGGPAGLMAAGQVAQRGIHAHLFEKMPRPGRKLSITGKGRCNITNAAPLHDFITHFGANGDFLRQAFGRFFTPDLTRFFQERGLELVTERGGRVFPATGKATDVRDALVRWIKHNGAKIHSSSPVDDILIHDGAVTGVITGATRVLCDAVILTTGGASYPATGSTGDGYRLAERAGHPIVPIRPALVPLETAGHTAERLGGLNLRNIHLRMMVKGKQHAEAFGEMLFTPFGVDGPVTLALSGEAVDLIRAGQGITLSVDLKPALDPGKLDARLLRDISKRGKEPVSSFLRGLLPRPLIPVCLDMINIPAHRRVSEITADERKCLRMWLKDFRLDVTGHRPINEAIITAGGVDTKEIDPRTMASRRIRGLFMAGELLDIQADTGGYNLQAAFSTGWLAGRSAARET
ncbi:MAG: NAD(P)/FAD-dependent oxidoreductase [Deltaproteobacteria bacterium]|nr:NAD(P)/FAD-dependent oxidoreductase [Deltaproteobacteria bacterium]